MASSACNERASERAGRLIDVYILVHCVADQDIRYLDYNRVFETAELAVAHLAAHRRRYGVPRNLTERCLYSSLVGHGESAIGTRMRAKSHSVWLQHATMTLDS